MSPNCKNPGRLEFDAAIQTMENGGAFVDFPFDVEKLYGVKGRVPVKVTFDGIPYQGSMVRMGMPKHMLLILKEIRQKMGKGKGDRIHVTVNLDDAPRTVALPADIEAAYKKAGVLERYRSGSYTQQKEYVVWIGDTKNPETRLRRITKSIEALRATKASKVKRTPKNT